MADVPPWLPPILIRIVLWLLGRLNVRLPVLRLQAARPYYLAKATLEWDASGWRCPITVTNVGSKVAENCYPQLVSIKSETGEVVHDGVYPLKWDDQLEDEVDYRPISAGGRMRFQAALCDLPPKTGPIIIAVLPKLAA